LIWAIVVLLINGWPMALEISVLKAIAYLLILPSISGFLALNFTGSSTYTSLSGVMKEMKVAIPIFVSMAILGVILLIVNSLISS
jgi:hypothetical protein